MPKGKKRATKKQEAPHASIRMNVNGKEFYAEGDPEEVRRKFDAYLNEVFSPIKMVRAAVDNLLK